MKKIVLMAAMMISSVAMFAQNPVGKFTIQPKIGMNLATVTDAGDDSDLRIGLVAGAEAEYGVTDMVGLSAGLLYSMQGVKGTVEGADATIKLDYINVPILANVYVTKGLAVKVGLQPGFKVSSKVKAKAQGVSAEADLDGVKSVDLSIPIGLSYEFNQFVIDGRYNWGVTKILEGSDSKHSVFQLTLGYKF